jgi:hypothetical protein
VRVRDTWQARLASMDELDPMTMEEGDDDGGIAMTSAVGRLDNAPDEPRAVPA